MNKKKKSKGNENKVLQDVEKIVGSRYQNNRLEYEVKWKDYDDTQWLQHHELMGCLHVIEEYELSELKAKEKEKSVIGENDVEILGHLQSNNKQINNASNRRMKFYDEKKMKSYLNANQNSEVVEKIDKGQIFASIINLERALEQFNQKITEDNNFSIKTLSINAIKEIDKDFLLNFYETFLKDLLKKAKEKELNMMIVSNQKK